MAREKLIHIHSNVPDKTPNASMLEYGELAVNYAEGDEFISLKNTNNDVIKIKPVNVDGINNKISSLETALDAETTARENADTALDGRVSQNETDIVDLKTRVTTVEGDVDNIDNRVSVNETNISTLTTNVQNNTNSITEIDGRVTTNETNIGNLTTRVTNVEGRVTTNETNISDLTTNVQNNTDNISSITTRIINVENTIGDPTSGLAKDVADNKAAIEAEVIRATEAEDALSDRIDTLGSSTITGANAINAVTLSGNTEVSLKINANDKILSQSLDGILSTINLVKTAELTYQLQDKNGDPIGDTINIPKDQFLISAEIVTDPVGQPAGKYLKLTFQTTTGEDITYIDLSALVDVYTGGNGININGSNVVSVKIDGTSESFLTLTTDGLKLSGLDWALNTISDDLLNLDGRVDDIETKIGTIANGAQVNVLEGVQVNGSDLPITNKKVNVNLTGYVPTSRTINGQSLTSNITLDIQKPLVAGTNITITTGVTHDTISATPGGSGGSTVSWGTTSNNHAPLNVDGDNRTVSLSGHTHSVANITDLSNTLLNYVTTTSLTTALTGYSQTGHTHQYAGSASVGGPANSVANALTIQLNGTAQPTYNGATARTINVTPASIGAPTTSDLTNGLSNKVDKEADKGLSTNDYTNTEKTKLDGIATGAQENVLEGVQVNGTDLTITNKKVNVNLTGYVPTSRTINGKPLTSNVTLNIGDIGDSQRRLVAGSNITITTGTTYDTISATASGGSTVSWGTTSNNHSPLTVDGSSKTVSLSGHSHSNLIIQLNGTAQPTYDGTTARTINITPTSIEAAASAHTHSYLPLSGGTLTGNLTVQGTVSATGGFFETSDETLKTFGNDIEVDFEQLKSIPKKYFVFNDDKNVNHIGTSAQKVQSVYPEMVGKTDDTLTVDYAKLSIVALKAIDVLVERIEKLESEIAELKK